MRTTGRMLVVASALLVLPAQMAHAQGVPAPRMKVCSLLTNAEIQKATGIATSEDPYELASACEYESGTVLVRVYSGAKQQENVTRTLETYNVQNTKKTPVAGLGRGAYVMFPAPRNDYEDALAVVVTPAGSHMLMITLAAPEGRTAQSMQPALVSLTKTVMGRVQ
jgi:hypothetical protein